MFETSVDLCIVGAGYAAVNALNAASHHLSSGARVAVIARENEWGGQWVGQYDFVRLHQPYKGFSAGGREWDLNVKDSHLANKREILRHFEGIVESCRKEKDLDLAAFFQYECGEPSLVQRGSSEKTVRVIAHKLSKANGNIYPQTVCVFAKKLIRATGFDISVKIPGVFSTASNKVISLAPNDVLTPEWNLKMRFSSDGKRLNTAPIYVVGSGKTSMDVIYHLSKKLKGIEGRLNCISGRGTWFMNRDELNPTNDKNFWKRNIYGYNTPLDYIQKMFTMYDGTNAKEVYNEMAKSGFLHTAVPGAENFMVGVSSSEEIATVKQALSPPKDKIIRAYLIDIVDKENDSTGGLQLKLSSVDGKRVFYKDLEPGAFVVNCTAHVGFSNLSDHRPVVSHEGLVLNPQQICGFSGPSANWATHLFYLNRLDPFWKRIPRLAIDRNDRAKAGMELFMTVVLGTPYVKSKVPSDIVALFTIDIIELPLHRLLFAGARFALVARGLTEKMLRILKLRYTDAPSSPLPDKHFGAKL
jgi:hypothetical protein